MKVIPLASESLGVRSMATFVETKDCKIAIDPSAALGPKRYGLPPAPEEETALEKSLKLIKKHTKNADIITVSHYHWDHYDPYADFWKDKKILIKDPKNNINKSQKERALMVLDKGYDIEVADGNEFTFGKTKVRFSKALPHGPEGVVVGFVIICVVETKDFKIIHASDSQGPVVKEAKDFIIKEKPDLLVMDGPPSYFLGWKFSYANFEQTKKNLIEIIKKTDCDVLLDHHLLRDLKYKERFADVYATNKVKSFAEYLGKENNMLEAHRKDLWKKQGN